MGSLVARSEVFWLHPGGRWEKLVEVLLPVKALSLRERLYLLLLERRMLLERVLQLVCEFIQMCIHFLIGLIETWIFKLLRPSHLLFISIVMVV